MTSEERFNKDYAKYYDLFYENKEYTKEVDFLENVFKKFSSTKVQTILDLGCGTGLHTQELIKRGYTVTGLDLSEEMVTIARKRNPHATFVVGDMTNFYIPEKFDALICMFSAMGYLTENQQLENFFKTAKKHLKEKGLFILDVWNGLGVMYELPSSREKIAEINNLKIVRRSFPNLDAKNHINNVRFNVRVLDLSSQALITEYDENHKVRFFFPRELKKYMDDAGFELLHICPSYNLNEELSHKHWNMVLTGKVKN